MAAIAQVWSLTQLYSVDFSKSRIGGKKCNFNKHTIKVCVTLFVFSIDGPPKIATSLRVPLIGA